ncbi:hypothetical protein [Gracilimonas sp.]|jgi:hypothetical protein|uniref:hypothetical protein n=1 Tax=Gracilimonas sp. TaxID=1974203 RepID=UPI0037500BF7
MKAVVKKYNLKDRSQQKDTLEYWKGKSIEHKLEVLDSLRDDAIKMGLYPDLNESEPRLQRVYKITSRS